MVVKDSKIKSVLRRIVRDRLAHKEEVTNKQVRLQAERALKLEPGFLNEGEWKSKHKDVIREAFEEEADGDEDVIAPAPAKSQSPARVQKDVPESSKAKPKKIAEANVRPAPTPLVAQKSKALPNGDAKGNKADSQDSDNSEDSDSSDDSEASKKKNTTSPVLQKPDHAPPKVNGVKRKAAQEYPFTESSEQDSDSEDGAEAPAKKKARSESAGSKDAATQPLQDMVSQPHSSTIPAQPYRPPPGFSAMKISSTTSFDSLSSPNLEGKQIWHLIVPSNINPASLSDLSLNILTSKNPEITIDDVKCTLDTNSFTSTTPTSVMIPTPEGYKTVPHQVERSLTLKQKIDLPNLSARQASQATGSSAAADVARPSVSTVRPQPKGLRMRYRPPGYGAGKLGAVGSGSESEGGEDDEQDASGLQFPKVLGGHGTKKRSTAGHEVTMVDADAEDETQESSKKERKRKEKHARESQSREDGTSPSKARRLASSSPDPSGLKPTRFVTNGVPIEADSEEEKARRKEEKRAKKEAKRKAKEASQS